jgi:hypothetical protein
MEEMEGSLDETASRKWRIRSWSAASDWAVREAEKVGGYERVWGRSSESPIMQVTMPQVEIPT